jgi:hypothetical protein
MIAVLCGPLRISAISVFKITFYRRDTQRYAEKTKSAARTARLPAAAPTIRFSRISNLYFQYAELSRKIQKKISGTSAGLVPEL